MKKLFAAIVAAVLLCGWIYGSGAPAVTNSFVPLKTGGGGLIVGADLSITGVRFLRADVFSGYIWTTNLVNCGPQAVTGCWYDIVNSDTMPSANFGVQPTTGTSQKWQRPGAYGVLEIAGAPSNSAVAYMDYANQIYVSTNINVSNPASITWTLASVGASGFPTNVNDSSNDNRRSGGRRMAVDPANPDHVIVGTYTAGVWETFNGRSGATATWTQISTGNVPLATNGYNIAFDPASGTTSCTGGVCTNKVYIFTNNASGELRASTDAGVTYSAVTAGGTPTAQSLIVAPTGGVVWIVSGAPTNDGTVWTYSGGTGGTWTSKIVGGGNCCHWITINPNDPTHVAVQLNSGGLRVSTDSGSTFSSALAFSRAAGDTPWGAWANENFMTSGAVNFDPLNNDLLVFGGGQLVWSTSFPSTAFVWTAISDGTEGGIGWTINVPQANRPIIGYDDLGSFTYNSLNNVNQSIGFPGSPSHTLLLMSGVSTPPGDSGFSAAKVSADFAASLDFSGYSTTQFLNTWLPFNTWNATTLATNIANNGSGAIRVTISDTSGLTTWSAGAGSIVCSISTINVTASTLNGGSTCFAVTKISSTQFDLVGSTYAAALSTTGGSYLFWTPAVLSDWNGNFNVTATADNGSGKIRVTYMYRNFGLLVNGDPICFTGVLGTTEANGCWIAESVATSGAAGAVTLGPSSTFANAYTGGGVGSRWQEPGGGIAAASRTNIVSVGGSDGVPLCTTDGGLTWTKMTDPTNIPSAAAISTVTGGPYSAGTTTIQLVTTSGTAVSQVVHIPMDDGRNYVNTIASISSPNITLNLAIPAGRSIANGVPVWEHNGWGFAAFLSIKQVAADSVQPNTFFAVNFPAGLYKWTNCGSPAGTLVRVSATGSWQTNGGANSKIKTVPGESGHLFYTSGTVGSEQQNPSLNANHPASSGLWRACNGDNNSAVTMQQVTGFFEPRNFGFGKTKPGSSYPAIYVEGWYDSGNVRANSVYGIWRSTDDANHGNSGGSASCSGGNTWTSINQWPSKTMSPINDLEGDPFVYGEVYLATGRGSFLGMFN